MKRMNGFIGYMLELMKDQQVALGSEIPAALKKMKRFAMDSSRNDTSCKLICYMELRPLL